MADKPAEILLFEYLTEKVDAAVYGDVLFEVELHDTIYQTITKDRGLRISDAVGTFSPGPAGDDVKEYDTMIAIAAWVRVGGQDQTQRLDAVVDVFTLQQEIYRVLFADSTWSNRVCESMVMPGGRGYDVFDGNPYAVANIPLIANPSGRNMTRSY